MVSGAGGGIGFEACRSLIWHGARVILAEIDRENGDEGGGEAARRVRRSKRAGNTCIKAIKVSDGVHPTDGGASRIENDPPLVRLVGYYDPMLDLARGYEEAPARLAE